MNLAAFSPGSWTQTAIPEIPSQLLKAHRLCSCESSTDVVFPRAIGPAHFASAQDSADQRAELLGIA